MLHFVNVALLSFAPFNIGVSLSLYLGIPKAAHREVYGPLKSRAPTMV